MLEEKAHSHTFQMPAFLPAQQHQPWDSWFASCHGFVSRWTWEHVQVLVIWINGNWDSDGQKREEQSFQNQIFPLLLKYNILEGTGHPKAFIQSPRGPGLQIIT